MTTKTKKGDGTAIAEKPSFSVDSGLLLAQLQKVASVIVTNPIIPILDSILFQVETDKLTVRATDLLTTIVATLEVDSHDEFQVAIEAQLLLDTLKSLPAQPIKINLNEFFTVTLESLSGEYQLSGQNPIDFPKTPSFDLDTPIKLVAERFVPAIKNTLFAACTDKQRYNMTGLSIAITESRLILCATDGARLVCYTLNVTDNKAEGIISFILRPEFARVLSRVLPAKGEVTLFCSGKHICLVAGELTLTSTLVDDRFPDYENAIPKSSEFEVVIDRVALLGALKRFSLFKSEYDIYTKMVFTRQQDELATLEFSSFNKDKKRQANERLGCRVEVAMSRFVIGIYPEMLAENIAHLPGERVVLGFTQRNRGVLITPEKQPEDEKILQILMPHMLPNYD